MESSQQDITPTAASATVDQVTGNAPEARTSPRPPQGEPKSQGSPSSSQVSVSSVGPTLVAALLNKAPGVAGSAFYDLTPITRNTSAAEIHGTAVPSDDPQQPCDPHEARAQRQDVQDHLSLPMVVAGSGAVSSGLPPMRVSSGARSQSVTMSAQKAPVANDLRPVPFPTRTKFFSFSGREEYEEELAQATSAMDVSADHSEGHYSQVRIRQQQQYQQQRQDEDETGATLTPYQPTREDAMEELPPEEVLGQIFAARRKYSDSLASDGKTHRLSSTEMAYFNNGSRSNMSDAPSLHMAHHLGTDNASFTTHTTLNTLGEDDDDSLLYLGDKSFTTHPSWTRSESAMALSEHIPPSASHDPVILEGFVLDKTPSDEPIHDDSTIMAVDGRFQREQAALEWLQSLPSQQIAEAASSKFLCSPAQSPTRHSATAVP
uniref:Uncharacterized protein n=1 Tax=Entomoneis paludosa TaxID=265537 RepID=A0A6U3CM90_9STRA|mmetsp:Transcript_35379/g.73674  ORF Transcript_35379/g.73674 Transcript_35379/m.73674 type:complete len:433 (+) Transcript_35379:485-1783(+)